jgi:ribosomal protein S18 acetylase RimI-like enzyme
MQIREATNNDIKYLVEFNAAMAFETEQKQLKTEILTNGVKAVLHSAEKGKYFIAEIEGEVVGQLLITTEWSDWRNGFFWWIQSVYVKPEHRRKGVFKALYQHVEALARQTPGICGLRLYVEKDNHRAQQTYEDLGMHKTHYLLFEKEF